MFTKLALVLRVTLVIGPLAIESMSSAQVAGVQAAGAPIVDCEGDRATVNRLLAGLPVQEEALKRSEAALDAARVDAMNDSTEAREKLTLAAVDMLNEQAISISNSSEILLAKEEGLKAAGISATAAARFKFLENTKRIAKLSDDLIKATKLTESYGAGKSFGEATLVQKTARSLSDQIAETRKLFVDSGLAEEVGAKLAEGLWGPIGEEGFRGIVTGLDLLTASMQAANSAAEADQAERNLETLRSQYSSIQSRVYELKQAIAEGCSNNQAKQSVASSAPPVAPPPSTPVAKPKGGGHTGLLILGLGGAAAAGVGAYEAGTLLKNQSSSSSSSGGGQTLSGHCASTSPSNACKACTCTAGQCNPSSQCGGDDCWTSSTTPPFC